MANSTTIIHNPDFKTDVDADAAFLELLFAFDYLVAALGPVGHVVAADRVSRLRDGADRSRSFPQVGAFSPAVLAKSGTRDVLDWVNPGNHTASNTSLGYDVPLSAIQNGIPTKTLTFGALVSYAASGEDETIVSITEPATTGLSGVLLHFRLRSSRRVAGFVRREPLAPNAAKPDISSVNGGGTDTWLPCLMHVDYDLDTVSVSNLNLLGEGAPVNVAFEGSRMPDEWSPGTVIRIGNLSTGFATAFLQKMHSVFILKNAPTARIEALRSYLVAKKALLNV